jgi:prepilin-type N-terminal cleavage/methylation domain-containing protein
MLVIIITRLLPGSRRYNGKASMNISNTNRRGFTLVEIMIVVAIIGLLASIAIPNFMKSRETANQTACISNLRQIEGAIQMWSLETRKDSGQTVAYEDISAYMRNLVACPSGGKTFADSYTITTVDTRPTCQRRPEAHKLPL